VLLRAFVITFFGIIACAAIVVCFTLIGVFSVVEGPPLSRGDLVSGLVFVFFAAVVLVFSFIASMRTREQGGTGALAFLARLAPVLMLVGGAGGAAFAFSIKADRARYLQGDVEQACELPSVWKLDAASCPAKAEACLRRAWKEPAPDATALAPLQALAFEGVKSKDDAVARFASRVAEDLNRKGQSADFERGMYLCLLRGGP
jgi:hypothetical protein